MGKTILFCFSQQLPRLRPLKSYLSWHSALQGPLTSPLSHKDTVKNNWLKRWLWVCKNTFLYCTPILVCEKPTENNWVIEQTWFNLQQTHTDNWVDTFVAMAATAASATASTTASNLHAAGMITRAIFTAVRMRQLKAVCVPGRKRTRRRQFSFVLDKACDKQTRPSVLWYIEGSVHSSCISSRTNQSFGFRLRFRLRLGTWTGY